MPKPPAFAKVFHEVRPDVFSVDPEFWHLVDGRCWAWAATSLDFERLSAGSTHVAAMLDGGVIARQVTDPDAWDEDALDAFGDGIWVVGNQVVRLLARLADLEQPARLEDEVEVPVVDELERAASAHQVVLGDAESQTELLRSCFDASDWDALVLELRRGRLDGGEVAIDVSGLEQRPDEAQTSPPTGSKCPDRHQGSPQPGSSGSSTPDSS